MPDELLSSNLIIACETLEARLRMLKVEGRRTALTEWEPITPAARAVIPEWLVEMHCRYTTMDVILQYPRPDNEYDVVFCFFSPSDLAPNLINHYACDQLVKLGFLPIADAECGDLWLLRLKDGPDGAVFWFEQSAWNGSDETLPYVIVKACNHLSELLSGMAVFESLWGHA